MDCKIEVAVRIRPDAPSVRSTAIRGLFGAYEVDAVHDECSTEDVFAQSVLPLVDSFLQVKHTLNLPITDA